MMTFPDTRVGNKRVNVKYMTQVKVRPPTFAVFCNLTEDAVPVHFKRFLNHKVQSDFNMHGVPIRFIFNKTKGSEVQKNLLKQG